VINLPLPVDWGKQRDDHAIKNCHRPILGSPRGSDEEQQPGQERVMLVHLSVIVL
jgi:hypothetical protein